MDKNEIISNLKIIASLQPGKTLSTTTMTIINHDSWLTPLWRGLMREDKDETITFIKNYLFKVLDKYHVDKDKDILDTLYEALDGFANLKSTYAGYSDVTNRIDNIITEISGSLGTDSYEILKDQSLEEVINNIVEDIKDQKNTESSLPSDLKEVVSSSDRDRIQETVESTIVIPPTECDTKDSFIPTSVWNDPLTDYISQEDISDDELSIIIDIEDDANYLATPDFLKRNILEDTIKNSTNLLRKSDLFTKILSKSPQKQILNIT